MGKEAVKGAYFTPACAYYASEYCSIGCRFVGCCDRQGSLCQQTWVSCCLKVRVLWHPLWWLARVAAEPVREAKLCHCRLKCAKCLRRPRAHRSDSTAWQFFFFLNFVCDLHLRKTISYCQWNMKSESLFFNSDFCSIASASRVNCYHHHHHKRRHHRHGSCNSSSDNKCSNTVSSSKPPLPSSWWS